MALLPLGPASSQRNFVSVHSTTVPCRVSSMFSVRPKSFFTVEERRWAWLEVCFKPRLAHFWSRDAELFEGEEPYPCNPNSNARYYRQSWWCSVPRFQGGVWYCLIEALKVVVSLIVLSLRTKDLVIAWVAIEKLAKRDRVPFDDLGKWTWSEKIQVPICTGVSKFREVRHRQTYHLQFQFLYPIRMLHA